MPYRLLALDLDGTSVEYGRAPTPGAKRAVAAAVSHGVHVILATGRPYVSARRFQEDFGLTTPLICFQGALVKETAGSQVTLLAEPLPEEPLVDVISFVNERGLEFNLYSEEFIYLSRMFHPESFYERWFGLPWAPVSSLVDALLIMRARGTPPLKGMFIGEPTDNDRLTPELQERFGDRYTVVRSHTLFVEITSPGVSKGSALAFLAGHYGVSREETIAVGDNGNDVSMIEWAGLGVAMANATPDAIAAADWVAPPVDEDGVATVIDKFILNHPASPPWLRPEKRGIFDHAGQGTPGYDGRI